MTSDLEKDKVIRIFEPPGHGGARDAKGAREAAETAAFLRGMQNLLAARGWIGVGSGILTALPSIGMTARELFAIGGMTIAHQSIASPSEGRKR